jgi:hypothetical protein
MYLSNLYKSKNKDFFKLQIININNLQFITFRHRLHVRLYSNQMIRSDEIQNRTAKEGMFVIIFSPLKEFVH